MWKFLTLNVLWFSILFLVHFFGNPLSRRFVFFLIFAAAGILAFQNTVDPLGWACYVAYSLVIYATAARFKEWAGARSEFLDGEIRWLSETHEDRKTGLAVREGQTETAARKANEIFQIYEKAREMSQSLDRLEAFVVFGEALAQNTPFRELKLVFLGGEEETGVPGAPEVYRLDYSVFGGSFDRGVFLRDRDGLKARLTFEEEKTLRELWAKEGAPDAEISPETAIFPVRLDKEIFAVFILNGCEAASNPIVSILAHSFASEMQRLRLYEQVEKLAITDGLTGVYVRRHLMDRFQAEIDRCKRFGLKLSFLMIDVDHFKRFNDEYGHLVGDVVLRHVAATIKSNTREVDLVGRYGGEEFGVLLIETDESHAVMAAQRIRQAVAEKTFTAYDENLKVTISLGCATYSPGRTELSPIVEAADSALYEAKRQGRDRVCVI